MVNNKSAPETRRHRVSMFAMSGLEEAMKLSRVYCLAFGLAVVLASCLSAGSEPQTSTTLCRALETLDGWSSIKELKAPKLARTLEAHGRARVTFSGNLYGPGVVKPDDLALPFAAALADRLKGRRYGHLNAFRTKLVVLSIVDVSAPSERDPWQWTGQQQSPEPPSAVPERLGLPRYPVTARELGVAGEVKIRVVVEDGQVVTTEVLSGDRLLAQDAAQSVQTWMFAPGTKTAFTTTFVYELEWLTPPAPREVVLFNLPALVKVTGARSGW